MLKQLIAALSLLVSAEHAATALYSTDGETWNKYSVLTMTEERGVQLKTGHVVGSITDSASSGEGVCDSLWNIVKDSDRLFLKTVNSTESEELNGVSDPSLGISYSPLRSVKNYRQFCYHLANSEFVAELDQADQLKRIMVKPTDELVGLGSPSSRLGIIKILSSPDIMPVYQLQVPLILEEVKNPSETTDLPPKKGNWWFGLMVAMIVMQIMKAMQQQPDASQSGSQSGSQGGRPQNGRPVSN